jgi:hypothetical protein
MSAVTSASFIAASDYLREFAIYYIIVVSHHGLCQVADSYTGTGYNMARTSVEWLEVKDSFTHTPHAAGFGAHSGNWHNHIEYLHSKNSM